MKKTLLVLLSATILLLTACNQEPKTEFSDNDFLADFDQAVDLLEKYHDNLFVYRSEEEFRKYVDLQRSHIITDTTVYQFASIVSELYAYPQCYHTWAMLGRNLERDRYFPLNTYYDGKELWVLNERNGIPAGSKIISIDGKDIIEIIDGFKKSRSADGGISTMINRIVDLHFNGLLSSSSGFPEKYEISFIKPSEENNQNNKTESTTRMLDAVSYSELHKNNVKKITSSGRSALDLKVLEESSTAILTIKHFRWEKESKFYNQFLASSFDSIRSNSINNLIIDIRGNGGGDPYASAELVNYLISKPYVYFGSKNGIRYQSLKKVKEPKQDAFKGKVFVWVDGLNASSSGHFISLVKYHNLGSLIGETVGSTFFCSGNPKWFQLKNTGIQLFIGRHSFFTDVKGFEKGVGISVDYEVKKTIEDVLRDKDPFLNFTLGLIKEEAKKQ